MAESIVGSVGGAIAQYPQALGHIAGVADAIVNESVQVAIAGDPHDERHRSLVERIASTFTPSLVLAGGEPSAEDQPALMSNRVAAGGRPTAYVCRGFTCDLPTTDPDQLERQVKQLVGDGILDPAHRATLGA